MQQPVSWFEVKHRLRAWRGNTALCLKADHCPIEMTDRFHRRVFQDATHQDKATLPLSLFITCLLL